MNIQKREDCIDRKDLQRLKTLESTYINAIRKNSNLANIRRKIYKDKIDWQLFYQSRVHKYMKRIEQEYEELKFKTYDRIHQWLNTDYRLYDLFNDVFKNRHVNDKYTNTRDDDSFQISIEDLEDVYAKYKDLDERDSDNLRMMKEVIDKYTPDHDIRFNWWR